MGSDSAFGEEFYKDVPRTMDGMIDLPIGTKVKLLGKHCIVEKSPWVDCCDGCILFEKHISGIAKQIRSGCDKLACQGKERSDGIEVYFKRMEE